MSAEPDPLKPKLLIDMDLEEAEKFVAGLQHRRLELVRKYEEQKRVKDLAAQSATREKMARKLAQLDKVLDKINSDLDKASTFINQLRGLRLELEDNAHDSSKGSGSAVEGKD